MSSGRQAIGLRILFSLLLALSSLTATLTALVSGVAPALADNRAVPDWPDDWQATDLRDHPLNGKIWSREKRNFVSPQDYGTRLAQTRFTLLGEVHDNPDHHRLQAWAIRAISKLRGARILEGAPQMDAVAMEMLSADNQEALDRFYGRNVRVPRSRTAADFGRLVKWDKLGWPPFEIYAPIIEAALNAYLVITPANPARAETRKVSKDGLGALPVEEVKRLALDRPLPPEQAKALEQEIRESHCGMLPDTAVPNMSLVQRLRDANMANAMLVSQSKGAALIAGNGHVRRDRAVPWYMEARNIPASDMVVVRHIEVEAGKVNPDDYGLGASGDAADLADFVVFTPREPRPDSCEQMRQQVESMKSQRRSREEPAKNDTSDSATSTPPR